jgi:bile acid-coenzyme A ligase
VDSADRSFAARFSDLADRLGDEPALTTGTKTLTFAELDAAAVRLAHHFRDLGVRTDDFVTVAEPNSVEFVTSTIACWKLGATPQPVSARLPRLELEAIVELADPKLVVGQGIADRASLPLGFQPPETTGEPLPDAVATSWKAPTSGGSTGRPKLIVAGDPSIYRETFAGLGLVIGAREGGTMIMPGPLYHNGPFLWTFLSLLAGTHVVLLPRFDAEATLDAVATHRGTAIYLVPTMMQRIWKLPEDVRGAYDVSSLEVAFHLAEPCPRWVKEAWIDWIGPDVLWELYGGTEGQAFTVLNGREWLEHRGSVGRPVSGEIRICDDDGTVLPPGETGDVWMRSVGRDTPTYRYVGAEAEERDGWECLGDVGWMDEDGYLYLADRRKDMILVGGANIYPAEVEAALNAHPGVRSSAVVGLPDEERGNTVHAIVEATGVGADELSAFLADRLVRYKVPRTYEFVDEPLRDDAGKVRRAALRADRV